MKRMTGLTCSSSLTPGMDSVARGSDGTFKVGNLPRHVNGSVMATSPVQVLDFVFGVFQRASMIVLYGYSSS